MNKRSAEKERLLVLEMMREFVGKVVPQDIYIRNLVISGADCTNKRIWTLRLYLNMTVESMAQKLVIEADDYLQAEKMGTAVSNDIISKIAMIFGVPINWLLCKMPLYPVPVSAATPVNTSY